MDLKARIARPVDQFIAGQSLGERRLEVMAAERDVQRFLKGKQPATELAANKLAQIVVGDRVHHEEVGHAYLADRTASRWPAAARSRSFVTSSTARSPARSAAAEGAGVVTTATISPGRRS